MFTRDDLCLYVVTRADGWRRMLTHVFTRGDECVYTRRSRCDRVASDTIAIYFISC